MHTALKHSFVNLPNEFLQETVFRQSASIAQEWWDEWLKENIFGKLTVTFLFFCNSSKTVSDKFIVSTLCSSIDHGMRIVRIPTKIVRLKKGDDNASGMLWPEKFYHNQNECVLWKMSIFLSVMGLATNGRRSE